MNLKAFYKITYGLYIVSSKAQDKLTGHISNTIFQVTSEPPQVAVCTNKDNYTTDFILQSGVFAVSMLRQESDFAFLGNFGFKTGRDIDKFSGINFKTTRTGSPIVLENTLAYLDCEVVSSMDVGSHMLFIGKVVDADIIDNTGQPLTYDYYRNIIKGTSPKNAPTYIPKDKLSNSSEAPSGNFVCEVCGYIYDPAKGDEDGGIAPGTAYDDIPDDWVCPICGADKSVFVSHIG